MEPRPLWASFFLGLFPLLPLAISLRNPWASEIVQLTPKMGAPNWMYLSKSIIGPYGLGFLLLDNQK